MASGLKIFSLYKVHLADKYYLLRTERPSFSNASQDQENLANSAERNKREYILGKIGETHGKSLTEFDFIGELQGNPIGDRLYSENGNPELDIYYLETEFGRPWIIMGNANSERDFLTELDDDEDLSKLKPLGQVKRIKATFVTENDF
ncbi:MAG: hypothetical protein LBM17_05075 [Candidatus Accumulibacter sp.]|nr:hypothetical protein [Accumulibacter sp.]